MSEIQDLLARLRSFRDERDWGQFHDPKNLALALSIEAAELNELFLWKKESDLSQVDEGKLKDELADVFAYAIMLAGHYGFDIPQIVKNKIEKNAIKYPVDLARGSANKYDDLKKKIP
jgi:NTP pyrophosphatase (non-canonical NTP hydrolase)